MIEADGTDNKARLGANATVGVSMAVARALATAGQLFEYLAPGGVAPRLPVRHFNVLNGGAHAPNSLDFQEFMIAPIGAPSMPEAVRAGAAVYAKLRGLLQKAGFATGLGDEGGFAPDSPRHHPTGGRARPAGAGDRSRGVHRGSRRDSYRTRPGRERVRLRRRLSRSRGDAQQCRHDRALRRDGRGIPGLVDRGRARGG